MHTGIQLVSVEVHGQAFKTGLCKHDGIILTTLQFGEPGIDIPTEWFDLSPGQMPTTLSSRHFLTNKNPSSMCH